MTTIVAILNHMVNGPIKDPASLNKPSSFPIPEDKMFHPIFGSNIHLGLVFGILACVAAWVLIERTTFGFQVRIIGIIGPHSFRHTRGTDFTDYVFYRGILCGARWDGGNCSDTGFG